MLDLKIHYIKKNELFGWDILHRILSGPRLGYIPPSLKDYWWYDDPHNPNKKIIFIQIPDNIREYLKLISI